MKYIKYLAIVLFAGALMTSCGEEVNVGQTTVQFADAVAKGGFGSGYVYVPIAINGANADAMNTSDVTVKIKVDNTYSNPNAVIGVEDVDYRITSYDMVFRNNYEIEEEAKDQPFSKSVGVEIQVLNIEPEVMEFKLVIESSNTQIGEQKECVVRLEKGPADRLCGEWFASYDSLYPDWSDRVDFTGPFKTNFAWVAEYGYFDINPHPSTLPMCIYFDEKSETLYLPTLEPMAWYSSADMQLIFQATMAMVETADGISLQLLDDPAIIADYDKTNFSYIKFPGMEAITLVFPVMVVDESLNPVSMLGHLSEGMVNPKFTRTKPSAVAPAAGVAPAERIKLSAEQMKAAYDIIDAEMKKLANGGEFTIIGR